MEYDEVLQAARTWMGPYCKACPVCNGMACRNTVPGPGSKGLGVTFQRNYQKWQEICVQMDTICENRPADTSFDFFGLKLRLPVLAAPVGAMKMHYGDKYDAATYNDLLVSACRKAGILACTGDGIDAGVMDGALRAIGHIGGCGVPTVKPWDRDTVFQKLEAVRKADPVAIAMDIDGAGLPFLQHRTPPAGSKTVAELREIIESAQKPFILKGMMTVGGARQAGGAAGHRRRRGRPHQGLCGRWPAHGSGCVQGAGAGRGRRAHRPPLRHHGLWRRCRGRTGVCGQAAKRAAGHHADVRRPQSGRDRPRPDLPPVTAANKTKPPPPAQPACGGVFLLQKSYKYP